MRPRHELSGLPGGRGQASGVAPMADARSTWERRALEMTVAVGTYSWRCGKKSQA